MTSESDDLEQQLRQNLELRRELGAEVAKAKDSSASQRVSRGFHWLGILLAAVLLVAGLALMVADGVHLRLWDLERSELPVVIGGVLIGLVGLGLACLALYGLVRAIGWVIGRFMAS
jgi:hypothetical protein